MNKKADTIISAIALVAVIGGSALLYKNLSENFKEQKIPVETQETSAVENSEKPAAEKTKKPVEYPDAPDFTAYDADGNAVSLSDYRGKPVVVNFWVSWCHSCKMELPNFQEAYDTYGDDVQFLIVNLAENMSDTRESAESVIQGEEYTFPAFYDSEGSAAEAYSIGSIPVSCFIDKDGKLVLRTVGALEKDDLDYAISLIK